MTLSITPVHASDSDAIEAVVRILKAVNEHDVPDMPPITHSMLQAQLEFQFPGRVGETYLASLDGEQVACVELSFSTLENLGNASFGVYVVPGRRRQGIGRELEAFAVQQAKAWNRTKLFANSAWPMEGIEQPATDAGPAFATALGYSSALPEVQRRLDLGTLDPATIDRMEAHALAKADGYRVVEWHGRSPEEYLDDIAYLDSRMNTDAPLGELVLEAEKVDADRVRRSEKIVAARGRESYHAGVLHEESGSLVAWTLITKAVDHDWHAFQQITIVEPEHRGHRLGALVKVANLRALLKAHPTVRVIDTFNAAENSYMISINEEMGFRPLYAWQNWQREI